MLITERFSKRIKKEREDIITKVKLKGREFEKEIIHKIETGIIKDWHQLALAL